MVSNQQGSSFVHSLTRATLTPNESVNEQQDRRVGWTYAVAITILFAAAALQAWINRYSIDPDGISYIELAWAFVHHQWASAFSTYWNPLYPVLLSLPFATHRLSGLQDIAVAHAVNFGVFLISFFSFRYFWSALRQIQQSQFPASLFNHLPTWAWDLLGYTFFLSCSLDLISLTLVKPDLALAALLFAIAGLLLRMLVFSEAPKAWQFGLLGLALATAYFAKPIMFVFALLTIAALFWKGKKQVGWRSRSLLAFFCFFVLVSPYIAYLSIRLHRPTISENGRLTYLVVVDGYPYGYLHGQAIPSGAVLSHPPRKIFPKPTIYEFRTPIQGSIPLWYNPAYWYDGLPIHVSVSGQLRQLTKNLKTFLRILLVEEAPLSVFFLTLLLVLGDWALFLRQATKLWVLLVPFGFLLLLIFPFNLESRLIGASLTVLWACACAALPIRSDRETWRYLRALLLATSSLLVLTTLHQIATDFYHVSRGISTEDFHSTNGDRALALGLKAAGLPVGTNLAFVGDSLSAYWAHIAGMRIAAEVPIEERSAFLDLGDDALRDIAKILQTQNIDAIVSDERPSAYQNGWRKLSNTGYYLYKTRSH